MNDIESEYDTSYTLPLEGVAYSDCTIEINSPKAFTICNA